MLSQLSALVRLAVPVILAELGWMFMSVVDTVMVGHLGPAAIGAVSVGGILFDAVGIFGVGLLLGLDTLVSQAFGAGDIEECDRCLWQGLYLAAFAGPPLIGIMQFIPPVMRLAEVQPSVLALGVPYLHALLWSLPPVLVYAAFRRYLQGMGFVRPVMFALLSANAVNALFNWLLIPEFGVVGAGWATCAARVYMALVLVLYAAHRHPALLRRIPRPDWIRIRALIGLGLPAGTQILLEVGVFACATVLAGRLAAEALAAHHISLNLAGVTFMVPLGISSAGAVLVGQAIGRGDAKGARRSGWLAIGLGAGFMLGACIVFLTFSRPILSLFSRDEAVLRLAIPLLFVAAVFQLFDGIQVTATGVLRGAGNTQTPMLANLLGHWFFGLPCGYVLCFVYGFGVTGLWMGLSTGLMAVASWLLVKWARVSGRDGGVSLLLSRKSG